MTEMYKIDYLIRAIETAASTISSYEEIAQKAGIRPETLWRIRKRKTKSHTMQTAQKILNAIEEIKNEKKS